MPALSRQPGRRLTARARTAALISGGLQSLGDCLLHPSLILAPLVFLLGGSSVQIASFTVAAGASWAIALVLLNLLHVTTARGLPIVIAGAIIRTAAVALIGYLGYGAADREPADLVESLILCFVAYQLAAAVTGSVMTSLIAGPVPTPRLANLFVQRRLISAILAVVGGLVAFRVLDAGGVIFPENIGLLLVLAAVSVTAGAWFLIGTIATSNHGITIDRSSISGRQMRLALGSRALRRFLGFRCLLGLSALADPFLIVYGFQELALDLRYVGGALAFFAAAQFAGTLLWPRWSLARSPRLPLQWAALFRLLAIVLILAVPTFAESTWYASRFDTLAVASWTFAGLFALLGVSASAQGAANQQYVLDLARDRPSHRAAISLTNIALGIVALAPLGAAAIIDRFSYDWLLVAAATLAFLALLASGLLIESRARIGVRAGFRRARGRPARTVPRTL